jgi:hypothetical protein
MYLLQFFTYAHLPEHLQAVSKPFGDAAHALDGLPGNLLRGEGAEWLIEEVMTTVKALPDNPERKETKRKLREVQALTHAYPNGEGGVGKEAALRLLLEAKDCAVRAVLFKDDDSAK